MGKIADVFFQALLEDKQLQLDAQKAGDKAGQTLGGKMSSAIGKAVTKTAFLGLSAGAAVATKGLIELDNITAQFAADTGATAEEAKQAGSAINAMAGRNIQPMEEIGRALSKVHTDLGLTGKEAEKTTEQFLRFGRATKQDAAAAVVAFDDILDAWGLTAADSQHVMDNLVASHQKYGGSIEENQRALAQLAPQLKALNFDIDDSQALLNLFAASGLDASKAQFALNSAIQKLPKGETLQQFITRLSKVKDDGDRARLAIEVFGARGGAGLANAIKPGIDSLDDFAVSAADMAGSTEKAAAALDNTFTAQVALRIKAIGSALIGAGQSFGPLLTGLASLASLGGALGLDKLFSKAFKVLGQSGLVKAAAAKAASLHATAYLKALILGDSISDALGGVWGKITGSSKVRGAIDRAGSFMGSTLGKVASSAFAAVLVLEAIDTFNRVSAEIQARIKELQDQTTEFVQNATREQLEESKAGLQAQLAELESLDIGELIFGKSAAKALGAKAARDAIAAIDAELRAGADRVGENAGHALATGVTDGIAEYEPAARKRVHSTGAAFAQELADGLRPAAEAARRLAGQAAAAIAQGIREKRDTVDAAWQSLLDALKNKQSVTTETAKLIGRLSAKELAVGMKSGDPAVRAQAKATLQATLDRLAELKPRSGTISKEAMAELRKAMKSKVPAIREAATDIYNSVIHKLDDTPPKAKTYGKLTGQNFADGIESKVHAAEIAASHLAGAVGSYLKPGSPTDKGPLSTKGGAGGWGELIGKEFARKLMAHLPNLTDALGGPFQLPRVMAPAFMGMTAPDVAARSAPFGAGIQSLAAGGTTVNNIQNVKVEGLVKARDPLEIARQLQRFQEVRTIDTVRRKEPS